MARVIIATLGAIILYAAVSLLSAIDRQMVLKNENTNEHDECASEIADGKYYDTAVTEKCAHAAKPPDAGPKHKKRDAYDWLYLFSQYFLVAVALGGIKVARDSLNSLNESVKAANRQANAEQEQLIEARNEFRSSQRAQIVLGNDKGVLAEFREFGDKTDLVMYLRNDGHLPAHNVSARFVFMMATVEKPRLLSICDAGSFAGTFRQWSYSRPKRAIRVLQSI